MLENYNFIDLFCGIGGFRQVLTKYNANCVFSSDINNFARETYEHNYGETPQGDITKISEQQIPSFDILCAGFPCQPFSHAGLKKGFNDTRGTLFFHIVRIIKYHKPKVIFLENVSNLLSHDNGKTIEVIKDNLKSLGYKCHIKILKASDYGLPQHRRRVYIVGFLDHNTDFSFPKSQPLEMTMSDILGGNCEKNIGFTLRVGGRGSKYGDRRNWEFYKVDGKIKRIGIEEGKKMMGLPKDFHFPVSNSQAMKQLGNSVAINVIDAIVKEIINALDTKRLNLLDLTQGTLL